MELPEAVKTINDRLIEYFGRFENGEANFRVVWSDDEIEKRMVTHTKEGFELVFPIMSELPKYSYIQQRFILERLIPIPASQSKELADKKISYEPLWVFEDHNQNALPPIWEAVNILVRTVLEQGTRNRTPYKIPEGQGNTIEEQEYRVEQLQKTLFGNETNITDALAVGEAVGYGTYRRNDTRFNNNPLKLH